MQITDHHISSTVARSETLWNISKLVNGHQRIRLTAMLSEAQIWHPTTWTIRKVELLKTSSGAMIPSTQQILTEQSTVQTPPVFLRKLRKAAVAAGCDVRLRVAVGGHPRPTLQWYRNDEPLISDDQDYGGLWIRDCKQVHGGLYTCVAVNNLGEARTSAVLAVLDLGEGKMAH